MDTKKGFFYIIKRVFKKIKLRHLLMLAIIISSNSFAWFIYATKVSSGIDAHIKTWNILFSANDNQIEEYVEFNIPAVYPGMDDFSDNITAFNRGEHTATLSYEIESAFLLGITYTKSEVLTSEMIETRLANDFPFKITFTAENVVMDAQNGISTFTVSVKWDYESGNDAADTYWGNMSYDFNEANPNTPNIRLVVKISAIQPD